MQLAKAVEESGSLKSDMRTNDTLEMKSVRDEVEKLKAILSITETDLQQSKKEYKVKLDDLQKDFDKLQSEYQAAEKQVTLTSTAFY